MHEFVYVCMHVSGCICVYVEEFVCEHLCMCEGEYVWVSLRMHECLCDCMPEYMCESVCVKLEVAHAQMHMKPNLKLCCLLDVSLK